MKILIAHLLRAGDLLMLTPVINAIRDRAPDAEIHLLVNRSLIGLSELYPFIAKVHYFDRDQLQSKLADPQTPLFQPVDILDHLLRSLNAERFDQVYNLSQNKLTGLIVSRMSAKEKIGLSFDEKGRPLYSSDWFRYLNDFTAQGAGYVFHYTDVYLWGCGFNNNHLRYDLTESAQGLAEIDSLNLSTAPIVLQVTASDLRKQWPLDKWKIMLKELQLFESNSTFVLLSSPAEEEALRDFTNELLADGVRVQRLMCSFAGAFSLLKRSRLLISLDTSIKHLAAAAGTAILEIALGPSDVRKTGAYSHEAMVVNAKVPCAPCSHFGGCTQARQVCSETLNPHLISLLAHHFLRKDWVSLKTVVNEYHREAHIVRTTLTSVGWVALPFADIDQCWVLSHLLSRSSWRLYMQQVHRELIGTYGSEGVELITKLPWIFSEAHKKQWLQDLNNIETELNETDRRLREISARLRGLARNSTDPERHAHLSENIKDWIENQDQDPSLGRMLELVQGIGLSDIPNLKALREFENHLFSHVTRVDITLKLLRTLKSHSMEAT